MADAPALPQETPQTAAAPPEQVQPINVVDPNGDLYAMHPSEVSDATQNGWRLATPQDLAANKYGGLGQQTIAGLEGAAEAGTFGASTALERAAGVPAEDIAGRREGGYGHTIGQAVGLGASAFIPGVGEANILEHAGAAGAEALGMPAAAEGARAYAAAKASGATLDAAQAAKTAAMANFSVPARIGSAAAKSAVENALFQSGDEVSKMFSDQSDPNDPVQTAALNVGLAGLIGAPFGAVGGAISPLWEAASGSKVGQILKGISDKVGGTETAPSAVDNMLTKVGADITPDVRARLTGSPILQEMSSTLEHSDTTLSGPEHQANIASFRKNLNDSIVAATGKDPDALLNAPEFSKAASGKNVGTTLAGELDAQIKPLSDAYEAKRAMLKDVPLSPSIADKAEDMSKATLKAQADLERATRAAQKALKSQDPGVAIEAAAKVKDAQQALSDIQKTAKTPGTIDSLVGKISDLASREGWTASPSSDTMSLINTAVKELPASKNLNGLSQYIQEFGANTRKSMDPLVRARGYQIQALMRKAEGDLIGAHIGSEEGSEALANFNNLRQQYAQKAQLKEAIDDRLHTGNRSTSGYAKAVKEMADQDPEKLIQRISGKNDAGILGILKSNFPKTAEALKRHHLDSLAQLAVNKEKNGVLNGKAILNAIRNDHMSPELKSFIFNPAQAEHLDNVQSLMEELEKLPHNFSNTARVADKLFEHVPGSVIGMAGMLTGHNPLLSALAGTLTKLVGKDVPDAVKLALLKFMGSDTPISAPGFKSAVEFIEKTQKGENLLARAAKNTLLVGKDVLPSNLIPTESDRNKLQRSLDEMQQQTAEDMPTNSKLAHYLPEHQTAAVSTASNAANYLNSIKPKPVKLAPLDTATKVSPGDKAQYNRALDIGVQPLVVLNHIKNGTLLPSDLTALKTMWPSVYSRCSAKMMDEISNSVNKGIVIPYKTV